MKLDRFGGFFLALVLCSTATAQNSSLTRPEVAAVKAKLVTVRQAMGVDPEGYLLEAPEEFSLPTDFNPNQQTGKYWPITSGVTMRYTDKGVEESRASAEQAAQDFQAKYAAAMASGDANAMMMLNQQMMQIQAAAMASMSAQPKQDMTVYVQFNMSPYAGIDPDAVVFEAPGVIALRNASGSDGTGQVTVYYDPVALEKTELLSKIELTTPNDGVTNKTGIFNVTITLNGTVADAEAWAQTFDTGQILSVIDGQ
jgi:hypothetical protein